MIIWQVGRVLKLISQRDGLQEMVVELEDGRRERALHDMSVQAGVREGDQVLLNTTAVQLGLGTGGYHFVHAILSRSAEDDAGVRTDLQATRRSAGHMMKLKYTSLQRAVLAAEEAASPYHEVFLKKQDIKGTPVLIGELHSMLPITCAWLRSRSPQLRVAYVMSDGGALPLSFSRHAAALKQLSWLCGTVTYGQAYGGDLETMNKFTALIAARHILAADVIIVCMGPGIAGTGTPLGHTGTEAAELVNAVYMLGGLPIMIARVSGADPRERHHGLSHHLLANLHQLAACPAVLPLSAHLPKDLHAAVERRVQPLHDAGRHQIAWLDRPEPQQLESALHAYPLKISTMGRSYADDPAFYMSAAAAAEYACQHLDHAANSQA